MIEQMKQLVKDEKFCVLATSSDNNPHCSLMAYATDDDCRRLYMITRKSSVKYGNLMKNQAVSLLIDTREKSGEERNRTKALTVTGRFSEIRNISEYERAKDLLLKRHPYLDIFIEDSESCIFAVEMHSFLLLDGFTDSYYEKLPNTSH